MIGAVHQGGLQIDHGVAGQNAVLTGLAQALFHGGEVVLGHRAAEDALAELQLFLLAGLELDPHVAELAVAAGLLLVAALDLDLFADLLPIGHSGGVQLGVHAEAALQAGDDHVYLHIAGAGNDHLTGLGAVFHGKGEVFLAQAGQAGGDLILLPLGLGGDGLGVVGLGQVDGGEFDHLSGVAQGVARLDLVHLADGADVAAAQLLDLLGLLAPHDIEAAQLFGGAGGGVDHHGVGGEGAGHDLHEGVLAVLVGDSLPHEGAGQGGGGQDELLQLAAVALVHLGLPLQGVGEEVDDGVQKHLGAQAGGGGAADHGEEGQVLDAGLQALDHLGVGKVLPLEEFVHELLAGLGHGFLQGLVKLGDHVLLALGHGGLHPLAAVDLIGALVQHVDDSGDPLVLVPDGGDQGGDVLAEFLPHGGEGGVEVGVVLVGFGDVQNAGDLVGLTVFPGFFRAHAHPALGGADDDGGVGHAEGLTHFAAEVEVARGVQHVDLTALVFHRRDGGGDGKLAADLLGIIVANGGTVGDLTQPDGRSRKVQHGFGQGSLSVSAVAEQTDVSDVLRRIAHSSFLSFLWLGTKVSPMNGALCCSLYRKGGRNTRVIFAVCPK